MRYFGFTARHSSHEHLYDSRARCLEVKVEYFIWFTLSLPKIGEAVSGMKKYCFKSIFYIKQSFWDDFDQQNSVLPIEFHVP